MATPSSAPADGLEPRQPPLGDVEVGAGGQLDVDEELALGQLRDELASEAGEGEEARRQQRQRHQYDRGPAASARPPAGGRSPAAARSSSQAKAPNGSPIARPTKAGDEAEDGRPRAGSAATSRRVTIPGGASSFGCGFAVSRPDASIGITVNATSNEISREKVTVSAWSPNSCPATPSTKTIGTKTQIVVSVLAVTARPTSPAPCRAASTSSRPESRRRWIDSSTTIELSTSRPMPRVNPPNDMMLSEMSDSIIRKKVAITETGIAMPMINVGLRLRRKR